MRMRLALWLVVLAAGSAAAQDVRGQVFLVTEGGLNLKLGAVDVVLVPEAEMTKLVADREAAAGMAFERGRAAVAQAYDEAYKDNLKLAKKEKKDAAWASGRTLIQSYALHARMMDLDTAVRASACGVLPAGTMSGQTDADGRFSIATPGEGRFGLVALYVHHVGPTMFEPYCWLLWVTPGTEVNLTNTNLAWVDSPRLAIRIPAARDALREQIEAIK